MTSVTVLPSFNEATSVRLHVDRRIDAPSCESSTNGNCSVVLSRWPLTLAITPSAFPPVNTDIDNLDEKR